MEGNSCSPAWPYAALYVQERTGTLLSSGCAQQVYQEGDLSIFGKRVATPTEKEDKLLYALITVCAGKSEVKDIQKGQLWAELGHPAFVASFCDEPGKAGHIPCTRSFCS